MHATLSRRSLIGVALAAIPGTAFAQSREIWKTYSNDRFGTSIRYPSRFRPGPPPANDDGQSFTAPDGAELRVWGRLNFNELDQDALERDEREHHGTGESIFDAERGERWFAFSGRRGPTSFFYRHYLLSHRNEVINAFEVSYPQDRKAEYEPIAARIAKSLRPGRAFQVPGKP